MTRTYGGEELDRVSGVTMINHVAFGEQCEAVEQLEDGVARLVDGEYDRPTLSPEPESKT